MHMVFAYVLAFGVLGCSSFDSSPLHGTIRCLSFLVVVHISGKPGVPFEASIGWLPNIA